MKIPLLYKIENTLRKLRYKDRVRLQYYADKLGVNSKILDIFDTPRFSKAWNLAYKANVEGWKKFGSVPDIQWRAHVCCWAAENACRLDGDFVEMGVHTGLLSKTICHYLDFDKLDKQFYLFDTFTGIPISETMSNEDLRHATHGNKTIYFDVFELTKRNFSEFSNVHLIQGRLPESINLASIKKISYLSIDLNSALYEKSSIETVWERIASGGIVVIDDYLHGQHREQYEMWNKFASQISRPILGLPTGQGLLIK